jgi:hypothetical protein
MPATPRTGGGTYQQGLSLQVKWHDCATVVRTGQRVCPGATCYDNVLVTDEYAPLEPGDGHQEKFYAPGVGNIRTAPVGGTEQESLNLTSATRLCGTDLARVSRLAMEQDQRAYTTAAAVYGGTPPAVTEASSPASC